MASSVTLVWSASSLADTASRSSPTSASYVVQYVEKSTTEQGGNEGSVREVTDINATEYTVTGLRAYTRYQFRVIAANGLGRGTPSSPLEVTTAETGQLSSCLVLR